MSESTAEGDHRHCPYGHEHPQPFKAIDPYTGIETEFCGACWHKDRMLEPTVECEPPYCEANGE